MVKKKDAGKFDVGVSIEDIKRKYTPPDIPGLDKEEWYKSVYETEVWNLVQKQKEENKREQDRLVESNKELARQERSLKEKQERAKNGQKAIRRYLSVEDDGKRGYEASKCFFDIMNMMNEFDPCFSANYNFIGNTGMLAKLVLANTTYNAETKKVEIDCAPICKAVSEECKRVKEAEEEVAKMLKLFVKENVRKRMQLRNKNCTGFCAGVVFCVHSPALPACTKNTAAFRF